jgi:hypothetical protein
MYINIYYVLSLQETRVRNLISLKKTLSFPSSYRSLSLPVSSLGCVQLSVPPFCSSKLRLPSPPACPACDVAVGLQRPAGFRHLIGPPVHGLSKAPMATALGGGLGGWGSAHIQDGAPRSWERVTGGGEAAWAGPQITGSWGRLAGHRRPRRPTNQAFPGARAMAADNSKQFWKRSAKLPGR